MNMSKLYSMMKILKKEVEKPETDKEYEIAIAFIDLMKKIEEVK